MANTKELLAQAEKLARYKTHLQDKDFLLTWEQSDDTIAFVRETAGLLREVIKAGIAPTVFEGSLGISIFRDKSTRTRYAFRSACAMLGLSTEELDESTSQIAHGETVRETAAMIGFLSEVVGIRDDMFLGEGHKYMTEVAASLDESAKEGVLPQRPAVVNLQCDLDHPTQAMADLSWLTEHFGSVENLRGKKLAMTWAYSPSYGKPLSVPQGVVALMTRFGMDVTLAHPEGYELEKEPLDAAANFGKASGGSFKVVNSMEEAFSGADIVYPKSWAPAWVMRERTKLLRARESGKLADLEKQALENNAKFTNWECDSKKMAATKGGNALYMHCLPADVTGVSCKQGEVAKDVFESQRLRTYREASHKPYVIAAMILATRFGDPAKVLAQAIEKGRPRRGV